MQEAPNTRIQPTGFASLRSARLRLMRKPLGGLGCRRFICFLEGEGIGNTNLEGDLCTQRHIAADW
jgi:hypothetical protein